MDLKEPQTTVSSPTAPAEPSLILRHMPSLDSIRGIAVLMVVLFHGFASFDWRAAYGGFWGSLLASLVNCGQFGVDIFFVLSGFLITGLLLKAREKTDYYKIFYVRRILRIVPVYLLLLLILKLWHIVDLRFVLAAVFFLANFSRLFGAPLNEYGSLWSLAVEEHFYLLWPACVRHFRQRALFYLLAATLVMEPLLRLIAIHISEHLDIHYKTPFVLDFIAYGAMLSLLVQSERIHRANAVQLGRALLAVSGTLIAVLVWMSAFHHNLTVSALADLPFTWGTCGLVLLGLQRDHLQLVRTGSTQSRGFLPFYGYISYGLYLINVLVYDRMKVFVSHHIRPEAFKSLLFFSSAIFVCIAISTGLAYLSRRYFESPILSLKNRWQSRSSKPGKPEAAMQG